MQGGGVLITPNCLLTAKHVFLGGTGGGTLQAWVGITNRNQATPATAYSTADRVSNANADIGLIFLSSPVPNVNQTNPCIKLASENNSSIWAANQELTVSGFGVDANNTNCVSNVLKSTNVNVNGFNLPNVIACVGPGTNDACQGDSGGSLVGVFTNNNISTRLLTGIVSSDINGVLPTDSNSTTNNCGQGGRYVKVSKYLDWIVERIFIKNTPDFVCTNGLTINTLPFMTDGCTMSWTVTADVGPSSNMFTVLSGNALSFTTAAKPNVQGFGTITLVFNSPGNPQMTVIKRV
jgi:secreted trypsin-like serine protease